MFNTLWFVLIHGADFVHRLTLVTALVVNKEHQGARLLACDVLSIPVMLSPVVIANIWNWVLTPERAY